MEFVHSLYTFKGLWSWNFGDTLHGQFLCAQIILGIDADGCYIYQKTPWKP